MAEWAGLRSSLCQAHTRAPSGGREDYRHPPPGHPWAIQNTPPGSNGKRELMAAVPRALGSRTGELILRIPGEKKIDKRVDHK